MASAPPPPTSLPPPGPTTVPFTTVKLILKAEKLKNRDYLSKNDPMCVISLLSGRLTGVPSGKPTWKEVGRTEMIRNTNEPEWARHIEMDYFFEERQSLKFDIYDVDTNETSPLTDHDYLGSMECDLAEIVSSGTFTKGLGGLKGSCGTITITCEEADDGIREILVFDISGEKLDKKDFFGKSDPYLKIYRKNDDGSKTLVYRTEFIRKTLNPNWKQFEINLKTLCNGDKKKAIFFECWDNDDDQLSAHDYIGSCEISAEEMMRTGCVSKTLTNEKKAAKKGSKYKGSGTLNLRTNHIILPTFLDFITGGTQLDFSVAIDFTASNGSVHKPSSLHFLGSGSPNQYEIATRAVLDICQHYNNSKLFDAYGFGAKMDGALKMVPVFSLSDPRPELRKPSVVGVDGVMYSYRKALNRVKLHGPTNFAPIINQAMRATVAKMQEPGARYHVLLIVTDGDICDMNATKKAIIDAAGLPLSIIIVGVGNDSFEKMDELDGDDVRLSAAGRIAERDIVQFVPMSKFLTYGAQVISDTVMARLAKEVLAEVPLQLTSYMRRQNIQPRPADNPFPRDPPAQPEQMPPIQMMQPPSSPRMLPQHVGGYPPQPTPSYQQQGYPPQDQGYPPQPGFAPQSAYAPAAPYPGGGAAPYPAGGAAPYPGGGAVPYPPQQQSYQPYPPQQPYPGQAPYGTPPHSSYPAPYPPQQAYPPQQGYPMQHSNNQQSSPYDKNTFQYPPAGAPYGVHPTPPSSAPYDASAPPVDIGDIQMRMPNDQMQNLAIH